MFIKVETEEGFHTKKMRCGAQDDKYEVTETFVTRMSSLVNKAKVGMDYKRLSEEIAAPLVDGAVTDEDEIYDYLRTFDLNEAITTGGTKVSYDEEVIY